MTQTKPTPATTQPVGKWKPYLTYKDSGIEWLGEIPAHWEVKRLKFNCNINPRPGLQNFPDDLEASFLPMECIGEDGSLLLDRTRTVEQVRQGYTNFQDNDVIVAKITPCFENGKGALCEGLLNGIGFGTTELHVLRANRESQPKYIYYLTKSHSFTEIGAAMMYGSAGQKRVPEEFVKNFPVATPPLTEQCAIAAFLDRETSKINTLISKKEHLIELLQEKRAALISQAVTKGLDANVAMKDSGIEWLGEIPAHWEVKRLKFIVSEPLQYGANESAEFDDPDWPRFIRITDIDETGALRDDTFKSLPEAIAEPYLLREGDLLFARSGATVGKTFMYRTSWGRACYAGYLIRARIDCRSALPEHVSYFTASASYWNWLTSVFSQSTIQNVNAEKYSNLFLAIPAIDEQNAIVSYLDRETAKIDELISRIREAIEKLREYSAALVSAAVTGKIDVRENVTG